MKIGILGGTFNPIHIGHIQLAKHALSKLALDKIVFMPAYIPPHKPNKSIIPAQIRYRMVELAIEGEPALEVSDLEIKLRGKSYSINTVKELKAVYGESADIYFIAGSDYARDLDTWKDIEELKKLCTFVIATRPGFKAPAEPEDTIAIQVETSDISSSDIRARIKDNKLVKDMLSPKVYDYIIREELYSYHKRA